MVFRISLVILQFILSVLPSHALSLPPADLQDPLAGGNPENFKYNLAIGLIGFATLISVFVSVAVYFYKRQKKKG